MPAARADSSVMHARKTAPPALECAGGRPSNVDSKPEPKRSKRFSVDAEALSASLSFRTTRPRRQLIPTAFSQPRKTQGPASASARRRAGCAHLSRGGTRTRRRRGSGPEPLPRDLVRERFRVNRDERVIHVRAVVRRSADPSARGAELEEPPRVQDELCYFKLAFRRGVRARGDHARHDVHRVPHQLEVVLQPPPKRDADGGTRRRAVFPRLGIRIERDQERGGEHVRRSHRADVRRVVPPDAYVLPADAMLPVPLPHVHALVERVRGVAPERGIPLRGMRERVRTVLLRAVLEAVVRVHPRRADG